MTEQEKPTTLASDKYWECPVCHGTWPYFLGGFKAIYPPGCMTCDVTMTLLTAPNRVSTSDWNSVISRQDVKELLRDLADRIHLHQGPPKEET